MIANVIIRSKDVMSGADVLYVFNLYGYIKRKWLSIQDVTPGSKM